MLRAVSAVRAACLCVTAAGVMPETGVLVSGLMISQASAKEKAAEPAPKVRIEVRVPKTSPDSKTSPDKTQGNANTSTPSKTIDGPKSWPKTLEEANAEKEAASQPAVQWTDAEVAMAKARCEAILKRIHAIAVPQPPIRQGGCGTPAPVQLISIGQNPQVSLSPPAIVNCDFAEALHTWMDGDVQKLALKHLGTKVIKIEVMSSYSCRNAYGRRGNKLSEHGTANALDIRGFVTERGRQAYVLEHWGTPQREILARIAAEKAKAEKALAEARAADKAAQDVQAAHKDHARPAPPATTGSTVGAPASGIARTTIVEGTPKLTITLPGGDADGHGQDETGDGAFTMAPNRLGGPKVNIEVKVKSPSVAAKERAGKAEREKAADTPRKEAFLHAAHASACQIFGTTLGPEANAAHRNHFHIDMAQRKSKKICD